MRSLRRGLYAAVLLVVPACGENMSGFSADIIVDAGGPIFLPSALSLTVKRTVIWAWEGGPHNVTFEDGATGSGDQLNGAAFSRDFSAEPLGDYRFRCTIHSTDFDTGMVGLITVP